MDTNLFSRGFAAGTAWAQTAKHVQSGDLTAAREYAVEISSAIELAMEWQNEHKPIPIPEPGGARVSAAVAEALERVREHWNGTRAEARVTLRDTTTSLFYQACHALGDRLIDEYRRDMDVREMF